MMTPASTSWPRQQVTARLIELGVIVLLGVMLVFGYQYVEVFRQDVARQQQAIELRPQLLQQYGSVQQDLRERRHDIDRVKALIVTREAIGSFVNVLEEMGRLGQVEVIVTDIVEPEAAADRAETAGPLQPVRLAVRATGAPVALLLWLHEVEQSQYLVSLGDWSLQAVPVGAQQNTAVVPVGSPVVPEIPRSVLMVDLILMTYAQD